MKAKFLLVLLAIVLLCADKLLAQQQALTPAEKAGILFMYEEEKMARDVYDSLFAKWDSNPFGNIRKSESMHMREMKMLAASHVLADPVFESNRQAGLFYNASLQQLYDELVAKGSVSFTEALKAGALVEETDIRDLVEEKAKTVKKDIRESYDFLIMASENHLRAFYRNLTNRGIVYEPVVLSKESFDAIINAENGTGGCNH